MKKIFYFLSLAAAAAFTLTSCQEEIKPHEPGEPDSADCYGVYFPTQDASGHHVFNPTQDKVIDITVARTNTKGAITVPIEASFSEDGVFQVGDAKFSDGQKETTLQVRFDKAKEGVNYAASFVITDPAYASKYNANPIGFDFDVLCVEMLNVINPLTNEPAVITFTESWWGLVVEAKVKYYEVDDIRHCETFEEVVVVNNNEDAGNVGFWGAGENNHLSFTWYLKKVDEEGHQAIDVEKQYLGYDYDDWKAKPVDQAGNAIYVYDWFNYLITDGGYPGGWPDWEGFLERNPGVYDRSYYDGNGGFMLNLRYYIPGLGGWTPPTFDTVGIIPGYTRVDYSLKLDTDYGYDGETPVYVEAGYDIAAVKYAVYEGELTATQIGNKIDGIASGSEAAEDLTDLELDEEEAKKYATLYLTPESTGYYTLCAVAYDANKQAQNSASIVFKHVAASDVETFAVDIDVFTEDTPARYQNYHDYDSFAYCILGSDLVDVRVGLYTFDTYAQYGLDVLCDDVKTDEDKSVPADVLEQINADGGYYTIQSGLKADTGYIILVWATNGSLDDFALDVYETGKLPYVWNTLGEGVYTDDVATGVYGLDPITVPCVVEEEASTPGLYRLSGFQQPLAAAAFEMTVDEIAEYENVVWRNAQIIIDATDPANVMIELQDYGVCFNTDDGFVDGVTSMYKGAPFSVGTLENGVIAFPEVKGLLCTIGGDGYYYANQHGAFKLVLPAASNGVAATKCNGNVVRNASARKEFFAPVSMKFEREVKAIDVKVKVAHDRKDSTSSRKEMSKPIILDLR